MKETRKKGLTLLGTACLLLLLGAVVFWGRQANLQTASTVEFVMDTYVEYRLIGKGDRPQRAMKASIQRMRELEKRLSMYQKNSDIARLNAQAGGDPVKVSQETFWLLQQARQYSLQTEGRFDLTIGPLSAAWAVTSPDPQVLSEEKVEALLPLVDAEQLLLKEEEQTAWLSVPGMKVDLGAVAKGYACDEIRRICGEYGVTQGFVSVGGNLMVLDSPEMTFGLRDPRGEDSEYVGTLSLEGRTMATTGDYQRYFMENDVRYHHVLDPRTGFPAWNGLISVTVIAENGLLADFLSTALFVAGKEEAMSCLDREDFFLVLIDEEENLYYSKGLEGIFTAQREREEGTF